MKESHSHLEMRVFTPEEIIQRFKQGSSIVHIKETLHQLFMGFYISPLSDGLDQGQREDLMLEFREVIDLLDKIEWCKD
jgi:hypothetical protein